MCSFAQMADSVCRPLAAISYSPRWTCTSCWCKDVIAPLPFHALLLPGGCVRLGPGAPSTRSCVRYSRARGTPPGGGHTRAAVAPRVRGQSRESAAAPAASKGSRPEPQTLGQWEARLGRSFPVPPLESAGLMWTPSGGAVREQRPSPTLQGGGRCCLVSGLSLRNLHEWEHLLQV